MRTDLYGLVHKAQRYHLFGFARELSRADLGDESTRNLLAGSVREIFQLLVDHARNEERYIHPLFASLGSAAEPLADEHRALEARLAAWLAIVEEGHWHELYRSTMRLLAVYLLHIDAEERAQAEILWPHYSDAQLGAVMARFHAERDPAVAQKDLERMLPALSAPELSNLIANMRTAPEPVREKVLTLARSVLGPDRWAEVERRLAT